MSKKNKNIWQRLLKSLGWTPIYPETLSPKSVICVAPHTSNRDFFIGYLYYRSIGKIQTPRFLIKKEWFIFPLNLIIKALGGLPVNRKSGSSTVDQAIQLLKEREHLHLGITPEGTRSYRDRWKTGFYRIALGAGVPIDIAKIDYGRKEVGIIDSIIPSGDMERDIDAIRSLFTKDMACYPEKFCDIHCDTTTKE